MKKPRARRGRNKNRKQEPTAGADKLNKFDFGVPSPQGMVMPIVMMIPKMIKMRIVDGG